LPDPAGIPTFLRFRCAYDHPAFSGFHFFLRLTRGESSTILARRDANTSDERGAHMLFVVEAATLSNSFDAASRLHQEASCRVQADGVASNWNSPNHVIVAALAAERADDQTMI
jgi:hypothetical protein